MLDAFHQGAGWTEEDKLVTAASVLFMDKKYEPFMTRASTEWRLRLLWDMYHSIFDTDTHADLSRILAASYLLFRPPLWNSNTTSDDIFSVVLQIMEKNRDWDAYDLLQRAIDRFPVRYGQFYPALHRFAETYRYDPGIHRGQHHYDVLIQPRSIPSTTVPIVPELPAIIIIEDAEEPTENQTEENNILDRNLFSDSQNIHTAVIQQGTRKSLEVLCRWYGEYLDKIREIDPHNNVMMIPTVDELIRDISIHFQAETGKGLPSFLHRVQTDPSMVVLFESLTDHPTVVVRLWDVLLWVWTYLRSLSPPESEELSRRFLEECQETKDTCFSGHMSRLVNTLVGFLPGIESAFMEIVETAVIHLQRVIQDLDAEKETDFTTWMIETDTKAPDYLHAAEWVHGHHACIRERVHNRLVGSGFDNQEIFPESVDVISDAWDRLFPHHKNRLKHSVETKRCCWVPIVFGPPKTFLLFGFLV